MNSSVRYHLLDACARGLPAKSPEMNTVVIYSPGHLGDILHEVPMLRRLREGNPDAMLIWLVGPWSEALARRYAGLADEIHVFGPNLPPFTRGKREWRQGLWTQWRLALALRRKGVDVLVGAADPVARFLANAICPRLWIGVGEWRPPRVRKSIRTCFHPYEKDRYEADALADLLREIGIESKVDHLEYQVTADEEQTAADFLQAEGVDPVVPLVILAPGSGWQGKNWLPERYGEVADWLRREKSCQMAWVGTREELALVPAGASGDFNWMGKTPLPLLVAVMARARMFVGNDGGLMHFAAAMDVPTVTIWGPTSPGKWGPKGPLHRQIRKVESCAGCIYWDYRESCRHDHRCMKAVTTLDVLDAIESVWSNEAQF